MSVGATKVLRDFLALFSLIIINRDLYFTNYINRELNKLKIRLSYYLMCTIACMLCSCTNISDMIIGSWQSTNNMYVLDDEDDPIRFGITMKVAFLPDKTYTIEVAYIDTELHEETVLFKNCSYSGTWYREREVMTLSDFPVVNITHFNQTEMELQCFWPFPGRNADELELAVDERIKSQQEGVKIMLYRNK